MKKKVRFLTDISFSEISGVDKPANDLATVQAIQVAKRADAPELNEQLLEDMEATPEEIGVLRKAFAWLFSKKEMTGKAINDLPDSDFAYIEPGGKKDDEGKTVPRSKRHFPIHDAAHVRNALARMNQSPFGAKAKKKILAAAKKFGIEVSEDKAAEADDLSKALDIVGLSQAFMSLAPLSDPRIAKAREELCQILVTMSEEQDGDFTGEDSMNAEQLVAKLREAGALKDGADPIEKAKMSAANSSAIKMAKGHMVKAAGHLQKAAASHPEDDDVSNASAHHAMAMQYMDKVDVGEPTDATEHGSVEDKTQSEMVNAGSKVEDLVKAATDQLRTEFSGQVNELKKQLDDAAKKSHTLEVENAKLNGELAVFKAMPAPARAMTFSPGAPRVMALTKGAEGAEIAGGNQADEEVKPGDPNGFSKMYRRALANPSSVRDPKFNGSMGKGA